MDFLLFSPIFTKGIKAKLTDLESESDIFPQSGDKVGILIDLSSKGLNQLCIEGPSKHLSKTQVLPLTASLQLYLSFIPIIYIATPRSVSPRGGNLYQHQSSYLDLVASFSLWSPLVFLIYTTHIGCKKRGIFWEFFPNVEPPLPPF